jgi:hypothetical protein
MRNRSDIYYTQPCNLPRDWGELRASLKPAPELRASVRKQIDRLRELEGHLPSIIPSAEHWDKPRG